MYPVFMTNTFAVVFVSMPFLPFGIAAFSACYLTTFMTCTRKICRGRPLHCPIRDGIIPSRDFVNMFTKP